MKVNKNIIRLEEVSIMRLIILNGYNIMRKNIAFASKLNSNLIFFSELKKARILYYNYIKRILFNKTRNIIHSLLKTKNFFFLNLEYDIDQIMIL